VGVWALREGALVFVPVRLGSADLEGRVQVREGLRAGDRVIVHSESELAPESRISVVESLAGKTS
ncbi:MAG: efflux transporter periplasmic adaptor subunit, partial [Candidatus Desulfobacillus denitrificans]